MVWALADSGSLPQTAWGVALGGGLRWPALELRVIGTLLPERRGAVEGAGPGTPGAEIGLFTVAALACTPLDARDAAIELGACLGWELGRMTATGTGVQQPHRETTTWSGPRLDLAARLALPAGALWLELLLSVAAPLGRDEFILRNIGSVYRPPSIVGRAGLGLGWGGD